jgi:hypothetical protein
MCIGNTKFRGKLHILRNLHDFEEFSQLGMGPRYIGRKIPVMKSNNQEI